jgi:dihydrofolate reductase
MIKGQILKINMKKIVLNLAVSLDGFIEGPNGETDWCIMDNDMGFENFLQSIDTIFYGRVSYDAWGTYQPESDTDASEKRCGMKYIQNKNLSSPIRTDRTKMQILLPLTSLIKLMKSKSRMVKIYGYTEEPIL